MTSINLSLKKLAKEDTNVYYLNDVISENKITVVLGAPGSGKSSILRKFEDEDRESREFIPVKNFLKLKTDIDELTKVLLLDGLDEYRSVSTDKTFVLSELGNKINVLLKSKPDLKVVISCREMDWYGESDKNALKREIKHDAMLVNIQPLNLEQQNELADLLRIENKDNFIEKFTDKGFLDNPQMFYMLSEIWKNNHDDIGSKINLYKKFIVNAREHNPNHQQGSLNIEQDDMFKITGYLAFYYMFCNVDEFDSDFIDEISSSENGYSKELIEQVLNTKLFRGDKFIHRTIAEYALANYIIEYKLSGTVEIDKDRIKSLFIKNKRIPTELRGTYAWLCSLGAGDDFIDIDPYYQAIHGDNSLFNFEDKKKIVLAVKQYSLHNPYFFEFSQKMELEGFYTTELDDLLVAEYDKAIELKNHYVFFIINIIVQGSDISDDIKAFAKSKIEDTSILTYFKNDFIELFKSEPEYLKSILEKIKTKEIPDESDNLKEVILRYLYPEYIDHTQIADYLALYTSDIGGYCYYLYDTNYEHKFELIDNIFKASYNEKREPKLILPKNVKTFIKDYYLETLLEFEDSKTAKEIYDIIKHFKQYYTWHKQLAFESYRYTITDKIKESDEKLQRLTNELFELYIDDILNEEFDKFRIHTFDYFFNYKVPNNRSEVLLKKINNTLDKEVNLGLFMSALSYLARDENNKPIIPEAIKDLVAVYHFEEEYENWLHPKKHSWQIESEKREKERLAEELETKEKNEEEFRNKTDEEIQKSFGTLHWIANLLYVNDSDNSEKYLKPETLKRLTKILKQAIYNDLINPELLTIKSLAKNSPHSNRNIDKMYYVSLALNNKETISIDDNEFKKYLYINVLHHSNMGNILESDFIEKIEQQDVDSIIKFLKEYIELLLHEQCIDLKEIVFKYVEQDTKLVNLKNIAMSYESNLWTIRNSILENFLSAYGFKLELNDLITLNSLEMNEDNKSAIEALIVFQNEQIEKFTINMAITFHRLIEDNKRELYDRFKNFESKLKINIINYMMSAFHTEESIARTNGLQSSKDICADFLTSFSLKLMSIDELTELSTFHSSHEDIWRNRILNTLNDELQSESDKTHSNYKTEEIKQFILNNSILSKEDFFTEICFKMENLKTNIEDNRDGDKYIFYNEGDTRNPKIEERCRDIILQRLKASYENILDFTKELNEGDNRVDINIRYKDNLSYEVQIECKRDDNTNLTKGIENQLVDKYFSSGVQYGIYLIFYFGYKKDKSLMLDKIYEAIPSGYENKIKIVCIDLTL